jgi:hypothetical protein
MGNYLFGKIKPKFSPPNHRDPAPRRFMVCKHVLACVPIVSRYIMAVIKPTVKKKFEKPTKIEIEREVPKYLRHIDEHPYTVTEVEEWPDKTETEQAKYIDEETDPDKLAYMAHKFPETASPLVVKRLQELVKSAETAEDQKKARDNLRKIPRFKLPARYVKYETDPKFEEIIRKWRKMSRPARERFVTNLGKPEEVDFMGHRFPETALVPVVKKLKEMAQKSKSPELKKEAEEALQFFV